VRGPGAVANDGNGFAVSEAEVGVGVVRRSWAIRLIRAGAEGSYGWADRRLRPCWVCADDPIDQAVLHRFGGR